MDTMSPFSVLNRYKVKDLNKTRKVINSVNTPREIIIRSILNSVGTVCSFHLELLWPQKHSKQKIKKLSRQRFFLTFQLEGTHKLNVYTLNPDFTLDKALRELAFAQFYMKVRGIIPCSASVKCPYPFTGIINLNNKPFPVLVIRRGDSTSLLRHFLKDVDNVLIIAEEFKELNIKVPYRITTDDRLLNKPIHKAFMTPDGIVEEIPYLSYPG